MEQHLTGSAILARTLVAAVTAALPAGLVLAVPAPAGAVQTRASGPVSSAGPVRRVGSPATRAFGHKNWSAYLYSYTHPSFDASDTRIKLSNLRRLVRKWHFRGDRAVLAGEPDRGFLASPTVNDGAVFIGSDTGWFYKLNEGTGKVLARRFLGFQPKITCPAMGIVTTATVTTDPRDHRQTAYVAAPDGYLYALRGSNLSVKWRSVIAIPSSTVSNYFQWSSPTVVNGRVYVGVASNCDRPLVRGGLIAFNQVTGARIAEFYTVPAGATGGAIWSSAAADSVGRIYVSTGNPQNGLRVHSYSNSIVKLNPVTLKPIASFTVPARQTIPDGDFGASPVIFGKYVGACNKNGIFYALLRSTMKLKWSVKVTTRAGYSGSCIAAAAYDGKYLYLAGTRSTVDGVIRPGSIRRVDAATGRVRWVTALPNGVMGTPTINGSGIIAVGTYVKSSVPDAIYLIDAANGKIVRTLSSGYRDFGQSVFADGGIVTADLGGVSDWGFVRR